MKLSNKGRYGVCAMFDIAFHNDGGPTQIKDIASRQAIPPRFLEQIFQDLKRAGLVTSKRGPRGGYALAQPAGDIRVGDIVRALEGPTQIEADSDELVGGDPLSRRVTQDVFEELSASIEACFDALNLQDLCAQRSRWRSTRATQALCLLDLIPEPACPHPSSRASSISSVAPPSSASAASSKKAAPACGSSAST
ncbi:MAG: Rrf2 family transcriptional regulator [Sandaracinaceae bacterium]|nr:Rrf2 family transcriptional regulator [Sandaracinaceae bacterium]